MPLAIPRSFQGAWRHGVSVVALLVCLTLGVNGYINFRLARIYEASHRDVVERARLNAGFADPLAADTANAEALWMLRAAETAMLLIAAIVAAIVLLHGRRIAGALRRAEDEASALAARSREMDERFATAREAGKLRLAAEASRLAAFVEHAPAAIAMFDSSLRYVTASRRWIDTFMRGSHDVAGLPFYEACTEVPRAWRTELSRVLEGEIVGAEDERWRPATHTAERRLRWEARPWHEPGSTQPGVLLFAQDVTRDREHEAQLERMRDAADAANRAKSEFLATMSHEIRTPMNGVLGFTQLLLDTPLDPQQREFARTIDASGRSLLALLNDILDYSKIEAGKLVAEIAPFDLHELVTGVAALLSPQCRDKRLELRLDYAADAPHELAGDATRLRQVLTNLVGNAIKFTARGHVRVEVRRDGIDGVLISVIDTGIGIPEAARPALFDKFVQVDSTPTRRFGGTGLGLAICKQLVELMGGRIGVHSREGAGSTFWVRLPVQAPAAPALVPTGAAGMGTGGPPSSAARPLILLAEDQPVNRSLVLRALAKFGHAADVAEDGAAAAALASRRRYDLILMDCQMPRMDGFEATAEIRALERRRPGTTPTPIVALSTGTVPAEREHCLAVGMQDVLGKPVIPAELECVLERWLPARCAGSLQTPREARSTAASDPTPDLTVLVAN